MMGFGFSWMVIFWFIVIGAGIWLLLNLFPKTTNTSSISNNTSESALAILKQRYARGELSKEEYETMRHNLER